MTAQRSGSDDDEGGPDPDPLLDGRLALVAVYLVLIVAIAAYVLTRPEAVEPRAAHPDVVESALSLMITVRPSGAITAVETMRIDAPIASLRLTLPPAARPQGTQPSVVDLTVNGVAIEPRQTVSGRWTVALPRRTRSVTLTYRLIGVTSHRASAPPGRALLQVRPLTFDEAETDVPVVVRVRGAVVLNMVCPDLPITDQLCGRETDGGWATTPISAGDSTVVAQVDLPPV
ncbi:hypothetical protein [Nocardioides sp. InS609-2]|uniref:hypothetical protein n=1 Tax=Nocardioides sp. InS609-2 TaxID=2760705 RepID=UPI0020BE5C4F|nr:hypothetical protein [Nocardioides sp. InS609-2]